MTCYKPLKGFIVGKTKNGKPQYKITSYDVNHVEIQHGLPVDVYSDVVSSYSQKSVFDFQEIPCGHCIGCRLDYSRQWADRCLLEMKNHKSSYFVTLTYDDFHVPINEYVDEDTGVIGTVATLIKRDFQLFMKRLRKNYKYDNPLRFFACGEYGSTTYRPHYHAIIFGLQLDDLTLYKQGEGIVYYNSAFLDKCWQHKGFVVVAKACWETCAYTARYIMKKQKGEGAEIYEKYNFQPEFVLMSRRPGIGRDYFDNNVERFFDTDCIYVGTPDGSKAIYPPRYFKKMLDSIDHERYIKAKDLRTLAKENAKIAKLKRTSNSYLEMLAVEERNKQAKIQALKRG